MSPNGNKIDPLTPAPEQVHSGEYFESARQWYQLLYETPVIERSMAIFIAALCLLIAFIALMTLSSLYPLNQTKAVFVENNAIGINVPTLRSLKESPNEPISLSIARIITERYVQSRENFAFNRNDLAEQDRLVYHHSSPQTFQAYRLWLQPNNPTSPVNTLGTIWSRQISNVKVDMALKPSAESGVLEGSAKVSFTNNFRGAQGNKSSQGEASINFIMPILVQEAEGVRVMQYNRTNKRLEFLKNAILFQVVGYNSSNLTAGAPQ